MDAAARLVAAADAAAASAVRGLALAALIGIALALEAAGARPRGA